MFETVQQKLEQFIKKYYTNELIKGSILFFAIGLFYFLCTLVIEYFLWLNPVGRTLLFWTFIVVELALFARFIAFPLAKLFHLQKGLSDEEASQIIGAHFPAVSDKLLNVIQLHKNTQSSDLLAASIDQKAAEMQPIPFKNAVNFKKNSKYLPYAAIPVIVILFISVLGDKEFFSSSYERVINYNTAYEPPAPFTFYVINEGLQAIENKDFTLKVRTQGDFIPENASIQYNNETYYLQQISPGVFEYTFSQPKAAVDFRLKANTVTSKNYVLDVVKTPSLLGFEMVLDYPGYTGKKDEVLKSSGNATIPEGTKVSWQVATKNTEKVALKAKDTTYFFEAEEQQFSFSKNIFSHFDYAITTSNTFLQEYENLSFSLQVIKDAHPQIELQSKQDSTDSQKIYFLGRLSDDYGLTKLQVVYYPVGEETSKKSAPIAINKSNFDQFGYTFPGNLPLTQGTVYEYYFEVFDNDVLHNYKSTRSGIYGFKKSTQDEKENEQLKNQENSIKGLDTSLKNLKDQEKKLEELSRTQKEKKELNYNDKKKLENFIKRQQQQEEMMKNFSKELKENLEKFQPENKEKDPFKEQLKERLKENEEKLKENEKLLEELEKLQEKIKKEELTEKLEELSKQNKNQEKNLEQLVELTKRYYVTKKAEKLADELYKLGEEQEKLADKPKEKNTKEAQEELNKKFEEYQKEKDALKKENEALKKPMELEEDKQGEKQVEEEQKNATDKLEEQKQEDAKSSQKKAGKKMKEMGKKMQAQMQGGQMETIEEDVEMLRQILDNLVVFSFEQEGLMEDFKRTEYGNAIFGKKLNIQNDLKLNFQHIDDSLFSLSLRQPLIGPAINESLTEVAYNLDKSMERLAENEMRQGLSSQQYTFTGANELAILLSDLLNNMQMQMQMMGSGKGKGQGQGFQLPDIIKEQESLSEEMEKGMKKGKKGSEGKGEKGEKKGEGQGESKGEGEGSGEGEGKNGKDGKQGSQGKDGKGEGEGDGQGESEQDNGKLFEIYKQQQQLRQQLQDKLSKEGLNGAGGELLDKMEQVEKELLDKGFNERTLQKMKQLKYEFLKLKKADLEQGQETERESKTNKNDYQNPQQLNEEAIKKYFNTTEILNREALPLRQEYKDKVNTYFKQKND